MAKARPRFQCIAPGCDINSFSTERTTGSVYLHGFPKDETIRKTWLSNLGIPPDIPIRKVSAVCSRHFPSECYDQHPEVIVKLGFDEKFRPRLNKNACPNIVSVALPTSQAGASTSCLCLERDSMPWSVKRARLLEELEFSECSKNTTSVGIQCVIPPLRSSKKIQYCASSISKSIQAVISSKSKNIQTEVRSKSVKVQTDPPPTTRNIGTKCCSSKYGSKSVKNQSRHVTITELNDSGTEVVDTEIQKDYPKKHLSQNDVFDFEEYDDPAQAPRSSCQLSQHLEVEVFNSRQFRENMDLANETKFVVFEVALLQLFVFCTQCLCKNSKTTKTIKGSMITINTTCPNNHKFQWSSQPELNHKPAGNILTAAAILFSGLNPSKVLRMFKFAGIQMFDISTFNLIQNAYLFQAIKNSWAAEQKILLQSLNGKPLELIGDCRSDSQGHSANNSSYCFMESSIKKIIHLVLVQKNQVENSVAMELKGLKGGLAFLIEKGVRIACIVTDSNALITSFLRKSYPHINHFFDCGHIVKSVKNKIAKACGKKPHMQRLLKWSKSIQNHVYWLASSSGGDKLLMRSKWTSLLRHLTNKHNENCFHDELLTERPKKWLDEHSLAYQKLTTIVTKLTEDIGEISPGCQTSSIKAFHAVVIQFTPKHTHYTFHGLEGRLIMAALHYNENSQKLQTTKNRKLFKSFFSPKIMKGEYSVSPIMAASTYDYVNNLMSLVMQYAATETYDEAINKQYY